MRNRWKKGERSHRLPVRSNLVVADMAGEDNGAVYGSTIVLNRKQLSKEDGWARTLIHEVEHLTEGTKEWDELARYLLVSGNSDPAFDAVVRNYFKGDETVGESALAKFQEGTAFFDLTEQEQLFLTELIAHETEVLFGSERMLRRIAKEKRSLAKRLLERIEEFFRILKMSKEERKAFVKLEQARACLEKALWAVGETREDGEGKEIRRSIRKIRGSSGKEYGIGVYLDSTLLSNLTENERIEMVKEYVKELGGNEFTAFDNKGDEVAIHIVESGKKFKNKSGKRVSVNKDLTAYLSNEVKQESIALIDELILTSTYRGKEPATHPHDWIDNNGANDWDVWTTYIQDKENTVWEAKLRIANSINGEKILYDIFPIKMVERSGTSDSTATKNSIHQNDDSVKPDAKKSKADADFESFSAEEFFREAAARSVSEVVGESEKSANAPEAPRATKKRGLSEGQAKKLEANYVNHKTFSRKEVAEVVDSITRKHLDFGEDYGVLIGKGRQEAI
ncbi:MAG: hypothetical protein IJ344_00850, partial [Clostridia bacterium]|nr:hypothetical protein [Clostridia bacterium]